MGFCLFHSYPRKKRAIGSIEMRFCFQFYTLRDLPVSELMGMILTKQLEATSSNQQRIQ